MLYNLTSTVEMFNRTIDNNRRGRDQEGNQFGRSSLLHNFMVPDLATDQAKTITMLWYNAVSKYVYTILVKPPLTKCDFNEQHEERGTTCARIRARSMPSRCLLLLSGPSDIFVMAY